jgi:hypothetical protein
MGLNNNLPASSFLTEAERDGLMASLRTDQREAIYPELLAGPWSGEHTVLVQRTRTELELHTVVLRHSALSTDQLQALGEFRLQQFLLCGWYDLNIAAMMHARTDPALAEYAPGDMHILIGDARDHRLLAYCALQAALPQPRRQKNRLWSSLGKVHGSRPSPLMGDRERPLFPTELGLAGPHLFPSLPALCEVPVAEIYEQACLLGNRVFPSLRVTAALIEAFCAMWNIIGPPEARIRAVIGNSDAEARHMASVYLGLPLLYAPRAQHAPMRQEAYWSPEADIPGRFWPYIVATEDIRRHEPFVQRMDATLDTPRPRIRQAMADLLRDPVVTLPALFVPPPGASTVYWTADPTDHLVATQQEAARIAAEEDTPAPAASKRVLFWR